MSKIVQTLCVRACLDDSTTYTVQCVRTLRGPAWGV